MSPQLNSETETNVIGNYFRKKGQMKISYYKETIMIGSIP